MAWHSGWGYDESASAEADLRTKQFFCLKVGTAEGQVNLAAATSDRIIGILQNKPNINQAVQMRILGISKGVTDGSGTAILYGDDVGPDANGRLIKKTVADNSVVGVALAPSAALGIVIPVLLTGPRARRTLG